MRPPPNQRIERYRFHPDGFSVVPAGENYGAFRVPTANGDVLRIVAAGADKPEAEGWEHVSVSLKNRCPEWSEMQLVKELFWSGDETVVQFHPAANFYVNCHPFCLHLWRRVNSEYELPPRHLI